MKYIVKVQYPWTTYYEREVEVEASNADHAADLAMELEQKDGFWDKSYQVGDGEAGPSEVFGVNSANQ